MKTEQFLITVTTPDDEEPYDLLAEAIETGYDFISRAKGSEEHRIVIHND